MHSLSSSDSDTSSSSSSSDSEDGQGEINFEDLFGKDKKKRKETIISQRIQQSKQGKIKGFDTPGEKGTHMIKIEITDLKDVRGVEKQNYRRHVRKKQSSYGHVTRGRRYHFKKCEYNALRRSS